MRLRRRKHLAVGAELQRPVGLSVSLTPADFVSALPVAFRDEVKAAHTLATEANRRSEQVDSRLHGLESRFEEDGTASERLQAVEDELAQLKRALSERIGGQPL
jgi:hypothetical protein